MHMVKISTVESEVQLVAISSSWESNVTASILHHVAVDKNAELPPFS